MLRVNNLVGFGAGAANRLVLEFKDSAVSSTNTVAWPSVAEGDLAVMFDYGWQSGGGSITEVTPSGFTAHVSQTGLSLAVWRVMISSKICDGTETGNLTGMNAATQDSKILLIFSAGITSRTSSSWNFEVTSGNPAAQNVAASSGTPPLIVFGMFGEDFAPAAFSTESPAFDNEITSNRLRVGYKIYNSSPQDHDIDANDEGGTNALASGYIETS